MKKLLFPGTVCIGNDILKDFAAQAGCYGSRFTFIGGKRSLESSKSVLEKSFEGTDLKCSFVTCGKICCDSEIARITDLPDVKEAEVICAVGGGSSMDLAKVVAFSRNLPLIMVPTTASSDAPCTFVALAYSDDGSKIISEFFHHKCPDMIMIDSGIIANAPARLIAAGMGDAMATWYEGYACYKNPALRSSITETALMLARLCMDTIKRDGIAAYESVKVHSVTPQLENVIEANCCMSSIGGLNTGTAGAHGIGDWLCSVPGGHDYMHGERVFIGLVAQMIIEQYPMDEIIQMMKFGRTVGLPVCVGDMGIDDVKAIADRAGCELHDDHFVRNLPCDHSPAIISGAIMYQQYLAENRLS